MVETKKVKRQVSTNYRYKIKRKGSSSFFEEDSMFGNLNFLDFLSTVLLISEDPLPMSNSLYMRNQGTPYYKVEFNESKANWGILSKEVFGYYSRKSPFISKKWHDNIKEFIKEEALKAIRTIPPKLERESHLSPFQTFPTIESEDEDEFWISTPKGTNFHSDSLDQTDEGKKLEDLEDQYNSEKANEVTDPKEKEVERHDPRSMFIDKVMKFGCHLLRSVFVKLERDQKYFRKMYNRQKYMQYLRSISNKITQRKMTQKKVPTKLYRTFACEYKIFKNSLDDYIQADYQRRKSCQCKGCKRKTMRGDLISVDKNLQMLNKMKFPIMQSLKYNLAALPVLQLRKSQCAGMGNTLLLPTDNIEKRQSLIPIGSKRNSKISRRRSERKSIENLFLPKTEQRKSFLMSKEIYDQMEQSMLSHGSKHSRSSTSDQRAGSLKKKSFFLTTRNRRASCIDPRNKSFEKYHRESSFLSRRSFLSLANGTPRNYELNIHTISPFQKKKSPKKKLDPSIIETNKNINKIQKLIDEPFHLQISKSRGKEEKESQKNKSKTNSPVKQYKASGFANTQQGIQNPSSTTLGSADEEKASLPKNSKEVTMFTLDKIPKTNSRNLRKLHPGSKTQKLFRYQTYLTPISGNTLNTFSDFMNTYNGQGYQKNQGNKGSTHISSHKLMQLKNLHAKSQLIKKNNQASQTKLGKLKLKEKFPGANFPPLTSNLSPTERIYQNQNNHPNYIQKKQVINSNSNETPFSRNKELPKLKIHSKTQIKSNPAKARNYTIIKSPKSSARNLNNNPNYNLSTQKIPFRPPEIQIPNSAKEPQGHTTRPTTGPNRKYFQPFSSKHKRINGQNILEKSKSSRNFQGKYDGEKLNSFRNIFERKI